MKLWSCALCLLVVSGGVHATRAPWVPAGGHTQIPIWPGKAPDLQSVPGPEETWTSKHLVAGKTYSGVINVTRPTITLYRPTGRNSGAAVVVLPGGGFNSLAMDLEGTEACGWLTSIGVTCVLLKYRVPSPPYNWHCDCYPDDFATPTQPLEDLQRTMGVVRLHAGEWHIDPHKVGVLGFSAGGFLVAEISTRFAHRLYSAVDAADEESARPDFAMAIYPGHLATHDDTLSSNVPVSPDVPPTFLVQAEDDYVDGVNQSLVYFTALEKAHVPVEMHLYAHGGHAFGLRRTRHPITGWPRLAEAWLRTIGMLPG